MAVACSTVTPARYCPARARDGRGIREVVGLRLAGRRVPSHSLSPGIDHGPLAADALRILVRAPPPLFLPDGEAPAAYQRGVGGPR